MRLYDFLFTIETVSHGRETIRVPACTDFKSAKTVFEKSEYGRFLPAGCVKRVERKPLKF